MNTSVLPLLVIFGADYTLWPYLVDSHLTPPYSKNISTGEVFDSTGKVVHYYEDVPQILQFLKKNKVRVGISSLTADIRGTHDLLEIFGWDKYIQFWEMFIREKQRHVERIHRLAGVHYHDIIFFDDLDANLEEVRSLGVLSVSAKGGMTMKIFEDAVKQFQDIKAKTS